MSTAGGWGTATLMTLMTGAGGGRARNVGVQQVEGVQEYRSTGVLMDDAARAPVRMLMKAKSSCLCSAKCNTAP